MIERRVDPFEFFSSIDNVANRLFHMRGDGLEEVLILTRDDGIETEAIVPIEEFRRTYQPLSQSLEEFALGAAEAIDCLKDAVDARIRDDHGVPAHVDKLKRIYSRLSRMEIELIKFAIWS